MKKRALITGVTGQDGAYLTELLLSKNYEVHGIKRRSSSINTDRIDKFYKDSHCNDTNFFLHYGDLVDSSNIVRLVQKINPDEIYNLAAMSHVKVSFEMPEYTENVNGGGTLRLLEALRTLKLHEKVKFYQASTSELYGKVQEIPQTEKTPFYPRSPYAVSKLYAYWITVNYREAYNMFASNGILFNHESPMRGETFVTRKITRAVTRIVLGLQECVWLGNLSAERDWGHAEDYVEAMYLILQHSTPDDFVIATGKTTSVRDFVRMAFAEVGVTVEFRGEGINEVGYVTKVDTDDKYKDLQQHVKLNQEVVRVDSKYFRPTEVDMLLGDASKAREILGWKPKHTLQTIIADMIKSGLKEMKQERFLIQNGFKTTSSRV